MRYVTLSALVLLSMTSCSKSPYVAQWNRPSSALDPVGFEEHKREAAQRASEGKYKLGEKITLRNKRVMVFEQNPQTHFATAGTVKSAGSATVLESDALFVKVEFDGGERGFINVSDIVDPAENFGLLPLTADGMMPAFMTGDDILPPSSAEQNGAVTPEPGIGVPATPPGTKNSAQGITPAVSPALPLSSDLERVAPVKNQPNTSKEKEALPLPAAVTQTPAQSQMPAGAQKHEPLPSSSTDK